MLAENVRAAPGSDVANFSRAVPGELASSSLRASSSRVSVIAPGREFQLVGFRWRGRGTPQISVQSEGARGWSEWVEPEVGGIDGPDVGSTEFARSGGSSEAVWTGDAHRIRVRVRGRGFSHLRAHFVRSVDAQTTARARVSSTGGGTAAPAPGESAVPTFVRRKTWDRKNRCRPRRRASFGEVTGTVVHHTVSTNSYSRAQAASVVLGICRFHRNSRRWNDIGYNMLVDRFGTAYEGRAGGLSRAVIGAHAQGYNGQTSGIALIGSFSRTMPPDAAIATLQELLRWKLSIAGVSRRERVAMISTGGGANKFKTGRLVFARPVSGHRDLNSTDCPGGSLYARLNELQAFLADEARTVTKLSARMRRIRQNGGHALRLSGRITAAGQPAPGKPIAVQVYTRRGWREIATTQSDASGVWQAVVAPRRRYYTRGYFAGDPELRAVKSRWRYSPKLKRQKTVTPTP